jgi:hypothetical protein
MQDLKSFLDEKAEIYNHSDFIENDPIQIPHAFSLQQDVEIAGFLASIMLGEIENPLFKMHKRCSILWEIHRMIL